MKAQNLLSSSTTVNRIYIIVAGISGFTGVALGAFGAHALEEKLAPDLMDTYNTGILYHLIHSVVLLSISLSEKNLEKSFWYIFAGIMLFSFSLYVYAISGITLFAMITPLGGISFLIGWGLIIYSSVKIK